MKLGMWNWGFVGGDMVTAVPEQAKQDFNKIKTKRMGITSLGTRMLSSNGSGALVSALIKWKFGNQSWETSDSCWTKLLCHKNGIFWKSLSL